jgi:DNA polymerase-4
MSGARRAILHADMDAFYASVEQRDDPALRGRPVIVGGGVPRGVVAAASYEARAFGIHSAMPTSQAIRRCPELVIIAPRIEHYALISRQIFDIFESYSPLVEPLSLDEAFVDLSGTEALWGPPIDVARAIKRRVREELDLVVSVGIAPNKFLAKIASDLGKPDGLVVVAEAEVRAFLDPLPVSRLWGVGKVAQRQLHELGIETIGALARYPKEALVSRFGQQGEQLWGLAQGEDRRVVEVERTAKSIGQEDTFERDIGDFEQLSQIVREQADYVARRLRASGLRAQTVVLKLKTPDFRQRTRQRRLARATNDGATMGRLACELLAKLQPTVGAVRLTGVYATALTDEPPRQLTLDEPRVAQGEQLGQTLDAITAKFGKDALVRGRAPSKPNRPRDRRQQGTAPRTTAGKSKARARPNPPNDD